MLLGKVFNALDQLADVAPADVKRVGDGLLLPAFVIQVQHARAAGAARANRTGFQMSSSHRQFIILAEGQ